MLTPPKAEAYRMIATGAKTFVAFCWCFIYNLVLIFLSALGYKCVWCSCCLLFIHNGRKMEWLLCGGCVCVDVVGTVLLCVSAAPIDSMGHAIFQLHRTAIVCAWPQNEQNHSHSLSKSTIQYQPVAKAQPQQKPSATPPKIDRRIGMWAIEASEIKWNADLFGSYHDDFIFRLPNLSYRNDTKFMLWLCSLWSPEIIR